MTTYYNPPRYATEYIFAVALASQASAHLLQVNPTLASGDVTVSTDFGAFANINTLPTVTPASGAQVKVTLSASEMTGSNVTVRFKDASGDEWDELILSFHPAAAQFGDAGTLTSGERDSIATALLKLDWTGITGEASRSVLNALRMIRNKWSISGTTLTVTKEDDSATAWTGVVTATANAAPITGSDPN